MLRAQGFDPELKEDAETEEGEACAPVPRTSSVPPRSPRRKRACADEHDQVIAAGGLTVIGTERHESRRIDNQLRGRAGRQGDPGTTQFYLSLEDDLMRLFGGNRMDSIGAHDGEDRHARRHAHSGRHGVQGHRRARSARSRACTSPPVRTCSSTTT